MPTVLMYMMSTWALAKMTLPKFYDADGRFLGAGRPGAVGRRGADRAGGADARRSDSGDRQSSARQRIAAGDRIEAALLLRRHALESRARSTAADRLVT